MTNKVGVEVKKGPRLELGYSPLTKTIQLAKMKQMDNGHLCRVGNDRGRDVTNEAAQMVWQLVMANNGNIFWDLEDGTRMLLTAQKVPTPKEGE